MKIKVLLNVGSASGLPPMQEGEHDVSREDGIRLIERGWAIAIEKPVVLKAVPPPASIHADASVESASAKATEDVKTHRAKSSRVHESKSPANKEQ